MPLQKAKKKEPKAPPKALITVWYEWFSQRLWASKRARQSINDYKVVVGFMKLFLSLGFDITRYDLLQLGMEAARNTLDFLKLNGSAAKSVGTVVTALNSLNRSGKMNTVVQRFNELVLLG